MSIRIKSSLILGSISSVTLNAISLQGGGKSSQNNRERMIKQTYLLYIVIAVGWLLAASSCLREQPVPIASSFSIEIAEDKTTPVLVQLKNESYGADEYEWTFEGGEPSSSREKQPGMVSMSCFLPRNSDLMRSRESSSANSSLRKMACKPLAMLSSCRFVLSASVVRPLRRSLSLSHCEDLTVTPVEPMDRRSLLR